MELPGTGIIKSRPFYRRYLILSSLLFSILLLSILALVGYLTFSTLNDRVFTEVYGASLKEALLIADALTGQPAIRGMDGVVNWTRVSTLVQTYIDNSLYRTDQVDRIVIRNSKGEVLTSFNVRHRQAPPGDREQMQRILELLGGNPLTHVKRVLSERKIEASVPIKIGGEDAGYIQVAPSNELVEEKLSRLRRELILKLLLGAGMSLSLLGVALYFVVRLLHKTRRLEAEAQQADRMAYVGTLARGLAHEIRNPLNAMAMNVQMLEGEAREGRAPGRPGDSAERLTDIHKEIRRLERLVSDFMDYAKSAGPETERQDINPLLSNVVEFMKAGRERAGASVTAELAPDLPPVDIDADRIRQAVLNVLNNAFEAADGGAVTVRSRRGRAREVEVEIEDSGPGIAPEDLGRVFEVFYSTKKSGSGLGLPIARRIVESHRGRIEVDSAPGAGTRVRIVLPASTAP